MGLCQSFKNAEIEKILCVGGNEQQGHQRGLENRSTTELFDQLVAAEPHTTTGTDAHESQIHRLTMVSQSV